MIERKTFNISTDTGTQGDTGRVHVHGSIEQIRWSPTTGDTGGDLTLTLLTQTGDTAGGFNIFADQDCLGAGFTKQPTIPQTHIDGFDTGASLDVPVVAAGERLRVKVTPGGAAVVGKLHVYVKK